MSSFHRLKLSQTIRYPVSSLEIKCLTFLINMILLMIFFSSHLSIYSGYYNLSTTISFPNITSGYIAIYKNGEEYSRSNAVSSASPVALSLSVSTIMYFNRDTDVADVRLFCTPSNILVAGQSNSFFTGSFIQKLFGNEP
jgi:hypothetical protein